MKQNNRKMIPFLFIILGSLITIISAYFDYRQKINEKEEQLVQERKRSLIYQQIIDNNHILMKKTNDIVISQKEVIDTTQKIVELQNELNNKNKEIAFLQTQSLKEITGANSIPKIISRIYFNDVEANLHELPIPEELQNQWVLDFTIENDGGYPLHDLRILRTIRGFKETIEDNNVVDEIKNLRPHEKRDFPILVLTTDEFGRTYSLTIKWRLEYKYVIYVSYLSQRNEGIPFSIKEHYEYKQKNYDTWSEIKAAMEKDLSKIY